MARSSDTDRRDRCECASCVNKSEPTRELPIYPVLQSMPFLRDLTLRAETVSLFLVIGEGYPVSVGC